MLQTLTEAGDLGHGVLPSPTVEHDPGGKCEVGVSEN